MRKGYIKGIFVTAACKGSGIVLSRKGQGNFAFLNLHAASLTGNFGEVYFIKSGRSINLPTLPKKGGL